MFRDNRLENDTVPAQRLALRSLGVYQGFIRFLALRTPGEVLRASIESP